MLPLANWLAVTAAIILHSVDSYAPTTTGTLRIQGDSFVLGEDGPEVQVHAGEMHYFRVPEIYWEDRLIRLRAMGLNAVSTYVPWNWHEQHEGLYDFASDRKDIVKFLKLAKEQGLMVILRAGPYICAEWEYGGLPAWLLKYTLAEGVQFRSSDERYVAFVDRYWARLLPLVKGELQENGGAIAMVQIENEFGAFQDPNGPVDVAYMEHLRDTARSHLGDNVLLISTDNSKGAVKVDGVFQAANLGPWGSPKQHLEDTLRPIKKLNGDAGPDFVMELWTGWFQMWHKAGWDEDRFNEPATKLANYVQELVRRNASFTLYMAHGGTNFGHWASGTTVQHGAMEEQPVFLPAIQRFPRKNTFLDGKRRTKQQHAAMTVEGAQATMDEAVHYTFVTTSYDYAAPLTEEGLHGTGGDGVDKYQAIRDILVEASGPIPEEPSPPAIIGYDGPVELKRQASLRDASSLAALCDGGWKLGSPQSMEYWAQQLGMVLYRLQTMGPVVQKTAQMSLKAKDRVTVWHGDSLVTNLALNIQHAKHGYQFTNVTSDLVGGRQGSLDILVENLGRRAYFCHSDFGYNKEFFNDWKGLACAPQINGSSLEAAGNWSYCSLPLEDLSALSGRAPKALEPLPEGAAVYGPAFFEGVLKLDTVQGDTFLRLDTGDWNTGYAFLNSFHLGRYWRDSRSRFDLYVPKSALQVGDNYIVLLEMDPAPRGSAMQTTVSFTANRAPLPY